MIKRIALASAGLLALAFAPNAAHAAACANGATNGYNMKDSNGTLQCVAGFVLGDGRILQFTTPVDQTGTAISPALSSLQTTGNNTLASILAGQATAALQGTANTSLASILSGMATSSGQSTTNSALGTPADTAFSGTGSASNIAALKGIYAQLAAILTQQTTETTANGSQSDTAYTGSGSASEIAALKGVYAQVGLLLAQQTAETAANGTPADTAYAGTGSASEIAALKGLYTQLGGLISANGTASDTAYAGSGSASQIAALKGVFAALQTLNTTITNTVVQTTAPGGTHTQVMGIEGAGNNANPVTTRSSTTLASPAYRIGAAVAGNNAQVLASGAKQMLLANFCNVSTAARVLKFYDTASTPVPGTTAIVTSIVAPAGSCPAIDYPNGGFPFVNGLAVAITLTGDGDTGSTVAAGDIIGLNIQHN